MSPRGGRPVEVLSRKKIEGLTRAQAVAHFRSRWQNILAGARDLPTSEQLRLAATLLEQGLHGMANAVLALATPEVARLAEIERASKSGHSVDSGSAY